MTIFGKILVFFNVLLVCAFVLVTAPLVKYRTQQQEKLNQIRAEIDGEPNKPGLRQQLADKKKEFDEKKVEFTELLRQNNAVRVQTETQLGRLRQEIADQENRLKTEREYANRATLSVNSMKQELQEREDELNALMKDLATENSDVDRLSKQVAALKKNLSETEASITSTLTALKSNYAKLKESEEKALPKNSTSGRIASDRSGL